MPLTKQLYPSRQETHPVPHSAGMGEREEVEEEENTPPDRPNQAMSKYMS